MEVGFSIFLFLQQSAPIFSRPSRFPPSFSLAPTASGCKKALAFATRNSNICSRSDRSLTYPSGCALQPLISLNTERFFARVPAELDRISIGSRTRRLRRFALSTGQYAFELANKVSTE